MLTNIARFELRYLLRNPLLWLTAVCTFALLFVGMTVEGFELGSEGGLVMNAAYATLRNYVMVSMFFMFVTTSFVANAVFRDDETGYGPIIRSTPITKLEYLAGRFLGAFAVAALCLLLVPLGIVIGTSMPWVNPSLVGPNRLADHLYAYFLIALPNLFIHSAILFALATITRSMMATYLGVIGFVSGFLVLQGSFVDRPQLRRLVELLDPFGARALSNTTRYWTVPERNVMLPDFAGPLLYNRLLWAGAACLCLALAYAVYRFADRGMSKRERKARGAAGFSAPQPAGGLKTTAPLPSPSHGHRAMLWLRTKFEFKQVVLSPAFAVLMAWGLFVSAFVLITQRDPDGRPRYPTTLLLVPKIEDTFQVVLLVVAIYYAGELVWRERDRRVHELVDASPMPNWGYVAPKTLAMALVLIAMLLTNVLAAIITQLSLGYTNLELGKYLLWYVLPTAWDMLLLAALSVFVQALSPRKVIGWGVMVAYLLWDHLNHIIHHHLLLYAGVPPTPLSDLNGLGSFWIGPWTFRLYWGAFAALLLLAAHLLWRRGTELRLIPRLARARRRLAGSAGWVAASALAVFIGTGAYAYYNTNILNDYQTSDSADARAAELEKKYWKDRNLPQPAMEQMTLRVDLDPEERRAVTHGRYRLRNRTSEPITDVHVRQLYDDFALTAAALDGAHLVVDDPKLRYRIYRFDAPMQPGEARDLTFETLRWHRGFLNGKPSTRLIENGTFLDNVELAPVIGISRGGMLDDVATRRQYGLPDHAAPGRMEGQPFLGSAWVQTDVTISTIASQTPVAPGRKVSDVTRGGRRIARFVSEAPIHPWFSIQSARYAEKHRLHNGVDLAVFYNAAHAWNVDRMLDTLAVSLDYYQANFGPYQFSQARIVEFPGYRYFAQAFAGTIPYSETYGFISDYRKADTVDLVTAVTAHELAHQYWAHQVIGADAPGQSVLSETLAHYSAMMVMKKVRGEDQIRRMLQFELDRYLEGRGGGGDEPPLARVEGQDWITYHKGALAMYLLQKRLGEEAVNRALRNLIHQYKFKFAPYPRATDLVALLRAEAKTPEDQNLITDLFERIALYDLKVTQPSAVRRADGRWDVTVPVEAKKLYGDKETPLDERIEVGLFTAEPGLDVFEAKDVIAIERRPIHTGRQVLHFVSARKPQFAGIDPYSFYIDRNSGDNVVWVK